jgi:hypothetical protein
MKLLGTIVAALAALAVGGQPALAQQPPAGADPWDLKQNAESCYLARSFGSGDNKIDVLIQSFGSTTPYHVILRGGQLPHLANRAVVARVGFGGRIAAEDVFVLVGSAGKAPMAVFAASPPHPGTIYMMGARYLGTYSEAKVGTRIDPAGDVLSIEMPGMVPLSLPIGAMQMEYARLDGCAQALEDKWSVAASAGAKPAVGPVLQDPDEVSWHMKYPEDMLLHRISGLVELRATIDGKGHAHDCVVQMSTWSSRFGEASCNHLENIAHFAPARDAQGNPVSALFHATAIFVIYNW